MKNNVSLTLTTAMAAGMLIAPEITCAASQKEQVSEKKNILFIAVDDLKPLLGCYGDKVAKTPNIDKLAAQGTVFTSAYCQQAVSAATRASLLTGWYPDKTQVWDLKTKMRNKNPEVVTLPQYYIDNGYTTMGIGKIYDPREVDKKQDVHSWSEPYYDYEDYLDKNYGRPVMAQYQSEAVKKEYKKYVEEAKAQGLTKKNEIEKYVTKFVKPTTECVNIPDDAYSDGAIANGAVSIINNYDYAGGKPMFLAVGFKKPHLPFCAPEKYWNMYKRNEMPLAPFRKRAENSPAYAYHNCGELQLYSDIPSIISFSDVYNTQIPDDKARELIHGYYACVSYMDAQVGKVIDALKKKGELDNTIIVLWGDHGWHLGDHGLWNKHTNFEQSTRVPYIIVDPSSKSQKVDSPVEFLSIYPTLCELSGLPIPEGLDGESVASVVKTGKSTNTKQYAVSQFPRGQKMGYSIRDKRYRYTVWVDWKNRQLNAEHVFDEELYDYEKDPNETINVATDASYAEALKQMKSYWATYKKNHCTK